MQSEANIQHNCIEYLKYNRWYVIHNYKNKRPRVLGLSDITAIKDGRVLWIEFKTATGKQRSEQIKFMNEVRAHGGEYIVIRSLDEIIDFLGKTKQKEIDWT